MNHTTPRLRMTRILMKNKKTLALALCLSITTGQANAITWSSVGNTIGHAITNLGKSAIKDFKAPTWQNSKGLIITFSILAAYATKKLISQEKSNYKNDILEAHKFSLKYAAAIYITSPIAFNFKYIHTPIIFIANCFLYPWAAIQAYNLFGHAINEIECKCENISCLLKERESRKQLAKQRELYKKQLAKQRELNKKEKEEENFYNLCKKDEYTEIEKFFNSNKNNKNETVIDLKKYKNCNDNYKTCLAALISNSENPNPKTIKLLLDNGAVIRPTDIDAIKKEIGCTDNSQFRKSKQFSIIKDMPCGGYSYSSSHFFSGNNCHERFIVEKLTVSQMLELDELVFESKKDEFIEKNGLTKTILVN